MVDRRQILEVALPVGREMTENEVKPAEGASTVLFMTLNG